MDATRQYTTRDAARTLQVSESRIRTWARLGGLSTKAGAGETGFTFQQLLLLRTTKGLLEAGISPRRVRRVWTSLRRQLSDELPLSSVRILADGDRAIAWDGKAPWQPDSGQFLLDFEAGEVARQAEGTSPIRPEARGPTALSADHWFQIGCDLEESSPRDARQAYRHALQADPNHADAHLNLGKLEHDAGELLSAEAHYREAARCHPEDATCWFNLGVLLEDRGHAEEAMECYRQAIARDANAADAHYNLGLLLEARGRRDDAMRHLMAARRLYRI